MTARRYVDREAPRSAVRWVLLASLVAGPVFVTATGLALLGREPVAVDASDWVAVVIALNPLVVAVGFLLALLPTILGTAALHWLGERNEAMRLPVLWALTGAGLAGGGVAAFGKSPEPQSILALAITGATCATLCRVGARWRD